MHIAGYQRYNYILQQTYKLTQTMNKPKSNKAWRIAGQSLQSGGWCFPFWNSLMMKEGFSNELKKFKKEE